MSRLLHRLAVRLARAPEDRSRGHGLTRRDTVKLAAGSAVALAAASALGLLAGGAEADPYCFDACFDAACNKFNTKLESQKAFYLIAVGPLGPPLFAFNFGYWSGFLGQSMAALYRDAHVCGQTNCGDPSKYPPPPGGSGGSGGGGGGGTSGTPGGCPPGTFACLGRNPTVCRAAGDVCCTGCGRCCTFAEYCSGCCQAG